MTDIEIKAKEYCASLCDEAGLNCHEVNCDLQKAFCEGYKAGLAKAKDKFDEIHNWANNIDFANFQMCIDRIRNLSE